MFVMAMDRAGPPGSRGGGRGGPVAAGASAMSPESAMASEIFDQLVAAGTFKAVLHLYRQICELLRLRPTNLPAFYPRLKAKLKSWKATNLWNKLDKRASHKCYNRGKACPNSRVLVIGAGPCGLRVAIEAQLLGAKVVVLEKRDRFSRNNVLHLWPFVIHDLRNLGAKKFFGKFCAGTIDHISIRQLQLILLKVALLLGVEVHENVNFQQLLEPPLDQTQERVGWRAQITPADHPVAQYEFDVLIGADGKRNTLLGFNRKEFRGKLAIAVTANFINRQSMEEASVAEISGVAFIFNQKFFHDMKEQTGVDLENIVYYKDDTHYFVMTAKKQSLLDHGVIINDYSDTARLLSPDNVDRQRLMGYARAAADFATNGQMPHLDFAVNHYGQADVAMFDFTSMFASENACRMVERRGHRLLQSLVGDCLLEPFWPTGSGCARGFLSALDTAWMVRSWFSGKMTPLQVLAEREACYRLLAQTTPENLHKDLNVYNLSPASRYPNLNLLAVLPSQVRCLCDTDTEIQDQLPDVVPEMLRKKRRRMSLIHPDALLAWCQRQISLTEGVEIENLSTSWKSGLALCAILNRYRPDLVDVRNLNPEDAARNNQLAFDICEREFGIPPIMTGKDMAECEVPDKLAMVAYVTQIYDTFRGEIPYLVRPAKTTPEEPIIEANQGTPTSRNILTKIGHKLHPRKRYSLEREAHRESGEGGKRTKTPSSLTNRRRSRDKDKGIAQNSDAKDVALTGFRKLPHQPQHRDQFRMRMKNLQKQLRKDEGRRSGESHEEEEDDENLFLASSKPSLIMKISPEDWNVRMLEEKIKKHGQVEAKRQLKVGRLRKDEWNLQLLEEKIRQQQMGPPEKETPAERPKVLQDIFKDKLSEMSAKLKADGGMTQDEVVKYGQFDNKVHRLEQKLHEGNMDRGPRGKNRVARMAQHMATILDWDAGVKGDKQIPAPPAPVLIPAKEPIILPVRQVATSGGASSESCCFCHKRVYLMERLSAEGLFFHRSCFRCEYCGANLRLGHYAFDRSSASAVRVFCPPHLNLQKTTASIQKDQRFAEMMKRKHAFLSGSSLEEAAPSSSPTLPSSPLRASPTQTPHKGALQPDVTLDGSITVTPVNPVVAKLSIPTSLDNRDRTPERVEFENTLLELSEDELLTSELEEEELTQKNFGPSHDVTTSDDEYSDLSTDTESDEDYLIEELEKSFTADGTRKLAETWQQKHRSAQTPTGAMTKATTPVTPGSRGPGERSGGSTTPEAEGKEDEEDEEETDDSQESDTETGGEDDTSDDIETDEEYASDDHKEVVKPSEEPVSCDIVMQVPVLQPRTIPEDSEEFTMSEEESDDLLEVDGGKEGQGSTPEETTSEEDEEPLPTPHQIPLIVINESPPQLETDKDWAEEMANALQQEAAVAEEEPDLSPRPQPPASDAVLLLTTLEKASSSSSGSSLVTSPEGSSQTTTTTTTTTQETTESTSNEMKALIKDELSSGDKEEIREMAKFFVDDLVLKATASLSSSEESEERVIPQLDSNVIVEPNSVVITGEVVKEELPADNLKTCLETKMVDSRVIPEPAGSKWEEIGINLPPLPPSVPLAATRNSMDKFRFIAGVPSPQAHYSPSKTSASPKELASKLNEFHRKIEELQKQLPSPPVSSPPAGSSRPDFWKTRGASPPVLECEAYYQSLQQKIKVPDTTSAVPQENKLPAQISPQVDSSLKKEPPVLDISIPNKSVPKETACIKSTDIGSEPTLEETVMTVPVNVLVNATPSNALDFSPADTLKKDDVLELSDEWKGNIEDAKPDPAPNQNDLNDELLELSKKYSFNPAFITLRKHNKLPPSHFARREEDERSSVENLLDLAKYKRPLPKAIGLLSTVLTNSQPELSPTAKRDSMQSPLIMSSSLEKRLPESASPNKGDVRFQGYGGSFADKIRPRSLVGDSIYLKSLSINLQKLAFPSLTKDCSFGGSCGTLKDEEIIKTPCKKLPLVSKSIEDILMGSPDDEKVAFHAGKEQLKDGSLPTTKKEKHDRMPFADDEKQSLAGGSILGSVENMNFSLPGVLPNDAIYLTPSNLCYKDPRTETEDERIIRLQRTVEQERARQEARERARMKSDEELGLSPCNYRKRYIQASSLSLGNYDELSSDDFLDDKDDMYEDDSDNEMDGVFHERKVAFSERIQSLEPSNDDVPSPGWGQETSPESGNATSSEKTLTTSSYSKTDPANYMESSLSPEAFLSPELTKPPMVLLCPAKPTMSSTESSPGTPEGPPITGKAKGKLKFQLDRKPEEEKVKSNGKKSLLSLLHFGRNSSSPKEKSSKNKSRSSSLPPDIRGRSKERSFTLLKFTKGRDRSRDKQKKKLDETVKERSPVPQPELKVVVRPKSASEPPEVRPCPPILKTSSGPRAEIVPILALPPSLKAAVQMENGLAPKASVDSFTDTEEEGSKHLSLSTDKKPKANLPSTPTLPPAPGEKEQRLLRVAQRVHRKQELKRFRTGQEIERRLQEIDVRRKDLEQLGVHCEKALRGEASASPSSKEDVDLMQEWFGLVRSRNKLEREEQELIIRMKDLELEERHSILQQQMRERMAKSDDLKTKSEVEEERNILKEMLTIVEKRDELVLTLDQLKLREEVEDRDLENKMVASGIQVSPEANR